jgi:glutamate/tyrosine decarboxylase-like PLP-dependent enzyme
MSSSTLTFLSAEERSALTKAVELAMQYMDAHLDRDEPVVRFRTPKQLEEAIDVPIRAEGAGFDKVLHELEAVLRYSVRTGHTRFFNQLWGGCDKAAVIGEWLTAVTNASMYTYEVAPVFSLLELYVLQRVRALVGWAEGDGSFAPGGAHCNLLAILAARNHALPHARQHGLRAEDRPVVFTSAHAHYTVARSASVIGFGFEGCVNVPVDAAGKMDPVALDAAIAKARAEGRTPVAVCATAGTTVLGAYDDFNALADVARKHGVWLHIDAAWGGHCLLSPRWKHLMAGAERADSVTWTATKCLGLPQQCAVVVLRHRSALYNCNAVKEDYLFHEHDEKDWDLGEKTLNCGRRNDVLKLWVSWKVYGDEGFAARVDHAFAQAKTLRDGVVARPHAFKLLTEPESLNVCFFYVPPSARALPDGEEKSRCIGEATAAIRRKMQHDGRALFNYSDLAGVQGHFFRFITCNPHANEMDMLWCLDYVEELGADL